MSYRDSSNPISERVADLLGRMTLVEKACQLVGVMPLGLIGPQGLDPDRPGIPSQRGTGRLRHRSGKNGWILYGTGIRERHFAASTELHADNPINLRLRRPPSPKIS